MRVCAPPVICACNGSAAGGGMEIALSCDMVVAAENAKFGCTEVGLGIIASTGGIVRLARDINRKDCMESAHRQEDQGPRGDRPLGLINYVVPPRRCSTAAIELAEECLKNAPLALKWQFIVHAADQMSEEDAMRARCGLPLPGEDRRRHEVRPPRPKRTPTDRPLGEPPHKHSAHEEPATEAALPVLASPPCFDSSPTLIRPTSISTHSPFRIAPTNHRPLAFCPLTLLLVRHRLYPAFSIHPRWPKSMFSARQFGKGDILVKSAPVRSAVIQKSTFSKSVEPLFHIFQIRDPQLESVRDCDLG
ncbi:MAG: enoyl-CoA hydratase/isomerase family protein [Adlercreutzia equolifaciens]